MKKSLLFFLVGVLSLTWVESATATGVYPFDLRRPNDSTLSGTAKTNDLGNYYANFYNSLGQKIIVTSFNTDGSHGAHLFYKLTNNNPNDSESGLGLLGKDHNEIQTNNFIQIDVQDLIAKHISRITLGITSVQATESFEVFTTNKAGTLPSGLPYMSHANSDFQFNVDFGTNKYVDIHATHNDVLIHYIATPEPTSIVLWSMQGLALVGGGFFWNRRRNQALIR